MMEQKIGNLIQAAFSHEVDVIGHQTNCFNTQKSGIASEMAKHFKTDKFDLEAPIYEGNVNKLGQIDYQLQSIDKYKNLYVVNLYSQYKPGGIGPYGIPTDYDALRLCFRKMNFEFREYTIGLPGVIGCGLGKGNPRIVRQIVREEFKNCRIIMYYLENSPYYET